MSRDGAIVPFRRPGGELAEARSAVARARERVAQSLSTLEHDLTGTARVRAAVRKHPVLTLGAAFLVGYALARLITRDFD